MNAALIWPTVVLVLLTLAVSALNLALRAGAVRTGAVRMSAFRAFTQPLPEAVATAGRHFVNLFEVPVLYYAAVPTILALGLADTTFVVLAWAFVVLRLIHSAIHLTYNNVTHRLLPYLAAFLVVVAMWLRLALLA